MQLTSNRSPARWDIFCRVVDNLGDIGVCWRLARHLARHHGMSVRLWVDDVAAFFRLCPQASQRANEIIVEGVEVRHWVEPFAPTAAADAVIEAFACDPPPAYLQAMAERVPTPLWINLEYLSAEPWVADCHRMRSPHARLPLVKYFFFPGFTRDSGGLLREPDLLHRRDRFCATADARSALFATLGLPLPSADTLTVSLFTYEQPALPALMRCWANGPREMLLLVPEGRVVADVARCFGVAPLPVGATRRLGCLTVAIAPFVSQHDYDRLLWSCALNFVRGEDSFVRAQWAARPFVWHIYGQDDAAHFVKLEAFMDRFAGGLHEDAASALRAFWRAWNRVDGDRGGELVARWPAFAAALPMLSAHGRQWAGDLAMQDDLATALVKFRELTVK